MNGLKWNNPRMYLLLFIAITVLLFPFGQDVMNYYNESDESLVVPSNNTYCLDNAGLFTDEQLVEIEAAMGAVARSISVAVVTTNDNLNYSTENYAYRMLMDIFQGENGVVFLIDMQNRELYLYTSDSNRTLTSAKCKTITDNVYRYARKGDYAACTVKALQQVDSVMTGIGIPQPMKHISNLLLSIVGALILVFLWANYVTKIKSPQKVYQIDKDAKKTVNVTNIQARLLSSKVYSDISKVGGRGFSGRGGGGGHGGGHGF